MNFMKGPGWEVILVAVMWLLALFLEWRRSRSVRRPLRLTLITLSFIAIAGIVLKPYQTRLSPKARIAILTEGSSHGTLKQLERRAYRIFESYDEFAAARRNFNVDSLVVVGKGLRPWQLASLNSSFNFLHESPTKPEGFTDFSTERWEVGKAGTLEIGCRVLNDIKITLSGPGLNTSEAVASPDEQVKTLSVDTPGGGGFSMGSIWHKRC